jgi:hypothetical protein
MAEPAAVEEALPGEGETTPEEALPGEGESTPEESLPGEGESTPKEALPGEGETTPEEEMPARREELPPEEPAPAVNPTILFDFVTEEPDGMDDSALQDQPRGQKPAAPPQRETPPPPPRAERLSETAKPRTPEPYERLFGGAESPVELTDLREVIQGHTRSKFVKRLFGRDDNRYEDVISSLNNSGTWREAALVLNSLYTEQGLDPFDPDVVEFTDVIHRRYLDAEKNGS